MQDVNARIMTDDKMEFRRYVLKVPAVFAIIKGKLNGALCIGNTVTMTKNTINLRQERKRRKRADKETRSEENRAFFGRTKAERKVTKLEEEQAKSRLDQHHLERDTEKPEETSQ